MMTRFQNVIRLYLMGMMILTVCLLTAKQAAAQNLVKDALGRSYICQGSTQPLGYSIVGVLPAGTAECGFSAKLFVEKTKSGMVVCGSSGVLAGYVLYPLDYVVAAVAPTPMSDAPCPSVLPQQAGWVIEKLTHLNTVCRLTNVLGQQVVVPSGYVVTAIDTSLSTSCPGPVITIRIPAKVETVCDPFYVDAPYGIPSGYGITGSTFSTACPQNRAYVIDRDTNSKKLVLSANSCSIESSVRSINSDFPTSVEFINNTSATVRIYWIDFTGQRILYNSLPAGQSYVQLTFVTHPWVMTDTSDSCLAIYFPVNQLATADIR